MGFSLLDLFCPIFLRHLLTFMSKSHLEVFGFDGVWVLGIGTSLLTHDTHLIVVISTRMIHIQQIPFTPS